MSLGDRMHRLGLRAGLEVRRLERGNSPAARRLGLLKSLGVDLVLDVGANRGQYARALRAGGYGGRIVSFEPLRGPLEELRAGPSDRVVEVALGAQPGTVEMREASNSASSSLLAMGRRHREAAPDVVEQGTEEVEVARLDDLAEEVIGDAKAPFLKLDVQGYELEVLRGAAATMGRIAAIEVEMSLVELYEGSPLLPDVFTHLTEHGFECVAIHPGFTDQSSGRMLQVDGLFARP